VASIALRNDAAKPENAQLRKRLITWWLNAEMNMGIYLDDMQPVFEADKAWEQLAQMHFEKWRSYHREGGPLYLSGYYLEKAGQVEEGKRRMRIAEFMPLGNSSGHGVMPWQIGKERAPQDLVARQKEVERLGCLGRSGEYRTLQRKLFHPYRKAGKPRKAALLWASANYHFITMSKGGSYSKLLWALNNGMHTEEGLGLDALQQGRVKEAEVRLKESWRLSIEPTWLGAALVQHYQTKGREKDARRIFNLFKDKLEQCSAELPNDPRFKNKLAEWREVTGF
jgi:hypothetical protein